MSRAHSLFFAVSVAGLAACTTHVADPLAAGGGGQGPSAGGSDASCPAGTADCGDGTCTPLDTNDHCGTCDVECTSHHGEAACVQGSCQLTCDAGYDDCNGDARDGCEASLLTDPASCLACGNVCDESDCLDGACVSILASATAAFVGADWLLTVGPDLYFATPGVDASGEIARVPRTGGLVTPLVAPGGQFWPISMRTNGAALVYGDVVRAGLFVFPLPSGPETLLVSAPTALRVLDVDATDVWLTDGTDIERASLATGIPTVIASGLTGVARGHLFGGALYVTVIGPDVQAIDDSGLDYIGHPHGAVLRVTGDTVVTIAEGLDTPSAVVADADAVYWAESGSLTTYGNADTDFNAGTLGRIARAAPDGSSRTVLADHLVQPVSIALDATHVYFANAGTVGGLDPNGPYESEGSLQRVPRSGAGQVETLFSSIDARSVAVDQERFYFSSWVRAVVLAKRK